MYQGQRFLEIIPKSAFPNNLKNKYCILKKTRTINISLK